MEGGGTTDYSVSFDGGYTPPLGSFWGFNPNQDYWGVAGTESELTMYGTPNDPPTLGATQQATYNATENDFQGFSKLLGSVGTTVGNLARSIGYTVGQVKTADDQYKAARDAAMATPKPVQNAGTQLQGFLDGMSTAEKVMLAIAAAGLVYAVVK